MFEKAMRFIDVPIAWMTRSIGNGIELNKSDFPDGINVNISHVPVSIGEKCIGLVISISHELFPEKINAALLSPDEAEDIGRMLLIFADEARRQSNSTSELEH